MKDGVIINHPFVKAMIQYNYLSHQTLCFVGMSVDSKRPAGKFICKFELLNFREESNHHSLTPRQTRP